jgi:hypothetical protein
MYVCMNYIFRLETCIISKKKHKKRMQIIKNNNIKPFRYYSLSNKKK